MYDALAFFLCLVDGILAISLTIYMIVSLSDIQFDFVGTSHGCNKLNKCVVPEIIITSFIPTLFLLSGHWWLCLFICFMSIFLGYRYFTLPKSYIGVYDPAVIRNGNELVNFQKESFIKMGYHLVVFFICLYNLIVYLLI